jgi:hypothetical protein
MTQNRFIGTWRLVSAEVRITDGQISYPWGQDALGYLMYNKDGYMMVAIMSGNRPNFASSDFSGGSIEEKAAAIDTYLSYGGKYEVKRDRVIHHIEVSSYPNWTGLDQERIFEFVGDRLELQSLPILFRGKQQTAHLFWQRI